MINFSESVKMTDWADDNLGDDIDEKLPEPTEVDKGDQRIKISYKWRHNEQASFQNKISLFGLLLLTGILKTEKDK